MQSFLFRFKLVVFLLAVICRITSCALINLTNVTVEETSADITYSGHKWTKNNSTGHDHDGTCSLSDDPDAKATFTFTGSAIYYYSSLFPFTVTTVITLDGNSETLDLTDTGSSSPNSTIRWSKTDLNNNQHTLVISPGNFAIVDALTYTTNGPTSPQNTPRPGFSEPRNITVEEVGPLITYKGADKLWLIIRGNLYHSAAVALSQDTSAVATFTFTGTALYYYANLWSSNFTVVLQLDNQPSEMLDLTDPSVPLLEDGTGLPTTESVIRWSRTNLTNTEHKLFITAGTHALLDAVMYTQDLSGDEIDGGNPIPTSNDASSSSKSNDVVVGIVGGVLGSFLLFAIIAIIILLHRRGLLGRNRNKKPGRLHIEHDMMQGPVNETSTVSPFTLASPFSDTGRSIGDGTKATARKSVYTTTGKSQQEIPPAPPSYQD